MKMTIMIVSLLVCAAPLCAEIYSWVDDSGTYNFTEDYSSIPKKYRKKLQKRGDMGAVPAEQNADAAVPARSGADQGAEPAAAARPAPPPGTGTSLGNFGGKSYDQWKQEFSDREAAMAALRSKIEELDAVLKKPQDDTVSYRMMLQERNRAAEQFLEMRSQYEQQVEIARKGGLKIDVK